MEAAAAIQALNLDARRKYRLLQGTEAANVPNRRS
jgi:hypothetical protein